MTNLNQVALCGNLTKNGELKYSKGGYPIMEFSIAVNRGEKQDGVWVDRPSFFDCTLFGKIAESLSQYLVKGQKVIISGHLKQERWTAKDGRNRSKVKVVCSSLELAGGKGKVKTQLPADDTDWVDQANDAAAAVEQEIPF